MAAEAFFLDSNGWVVLLNSRETLHAPANEIWQQLGRVRRPILLTDWIVAETGNSLARTTSRPRFREAVRRLLATPDARVILVSAALRARALDLYTDRPDKTWGLVDCASFIVMGDAGVTEAFTTDRHFEQAGFKCLLPGAAE